MRPKTLTFLHRSLFALLHPELREFSHGLHGSRPPRRLTGKSAAETISAMLAVFGRIDPHLRRSITFDNDTAFAQHALFRTMRDMTTWFCDAHASWQKGGIENAN
jgi:hypothetical protein